MQYLTAMVIPLNPEGMGIGEWLILFSENFEGMGTGMGNSKELCAWAQIFVFGTASESERQFASKNQKFFRYSSLSKMGVLVLENNDELRHLALLTTVTPNFSHCVS